MKRFLITSLVLFVLFFSPTFVSAQERFAECDECGYCQGKEQPGNWDKCADCLYKGIPNTLLVVTPTADPEKPLTDEEKKEFARPIKPAPGRYYTQLGCIITDLSTFQDPAAAGGLLNFLLTRLIFPVAGVLGFLALLYGAFLLITAQGNSMQIQIGKSYIIGAIVGLIFVFSSILLVSLVGQDILRIPWFSEGTTIKITAAGIRNGPQATEIALPIMTLKINGQEVKRWDAISFISPQPTDYKEYVYKIAGKIDLQNSSVSVGYPNDYCSGYGTCQARSGMPNANRDIYVNKLEINGQECGKYAYFRFNAGDTLNEGKNLRMYWSGDATCREWVDSV